MINVQSDSWIVGRQEYREENKLDGKTIHTLESSISERAGELLSWLKTKRKISYWDRRKHPYRANVHAFTESFDGSSCIWLNPEHPDVLDSFVHEIGQVYLDVLGYRDAKPAESPNRKVAEENFEIANYTVNAFRMAVAERKLEDYGIDRSTYRKRAYNGFVSMLEKLPPVHDPRYQALMQPLIRAKLCYRYVSTRLILGKEFGQLEEMWQDKIRFPEISMQAKEIFRKAVGSDLSPAGYRTLQRHLLKVLNLEGRALV